MFPKGHWGLMKNCRKEPIFRCRSLFILACILNYTCSSSKEKKAAGRESFHNLKLKRENKMCILQVTFLSSRYQERSHGEAWKGEAMFEITGKNKSNKSIQGISGLVNNQKKWMQSMTAFIIWYGHMSNAFLPVLLIQRAKTQFHAI